MECLQVYRCLPCRSHCWFTNPPIRLRVNYLPSCGHRPFHQLNPSNSDVHTTQKHFSLFLRDRRIALFLYAWIHRSVSTSVTSVRVLWLLLPDILSSVYFFPVEKCGLITCWKQNHFIFHPKKVEARQRSVLRKVVFNYRYTLANCRTTTMVYIFEKRFLFPGSRPAIFAGAWKRP